LGRRPTPNRKTRPEPLDRLYGATIAEALDLHGYRADEVAPALRAFLSTWRRRGNGLVVHVITGRGKSSGGRPVLRGKVASLLRGELAALVAEWGPDYHDGGYLVRLR
jgi:DNA-nicking Smr family endonuclease